MSSRLGVAVWAFILTGPILLAQCALDRALQLHRAGDFPGAAREYQACLAAKPDRADVRSNLGAVLVQLGRFEDAIIQYKEALKAASPEIAAQLRFNLALAYYKSFQIPEAAVELEALHTARPADLNLALLLADCRLRTAAFQSAIDLLTPFEVTQPDQPALDYVLGMALLRNGRVAEGQSRVDRILHRGNSAEGHFLLGTAMFTAGNFPGAVVEFGKAVALNPDLPALQSYYGQALLFTGDADGATAAFRKELSANPNDFDANFQLASILTHRGKSADARPLLERAALVRPGSQAARDALAHGFSSDRRAEADAGVAVGATAPPVPGLDLVHRPRPLVLVFGSYTCPKLRSSAAEIRRLAAANAGRVDFRLIYIREAHSQGGAEAGWQSTINIKEGIALEPARTLQEKEEHAAFCLRKLELGFPAVTDTMDDAAEAAYQAWPSRLYVIGRDGKVVYQTRLGELDFKPAELETVLRK